MKRVVVDASVAVKWVVEEPHTPEALRVYGTFQLTAPALIHAEVASALTKKVSRGQLEGEEAARKMREIVRAGVDTVPDEHLSVMAVRLSSSLNHPVYDCFYLALAQAEEIPVVTADRALVSTARDAGLGASVLWIEDA